MVNKPDWTLDHIVANLNRAGVAWLNTTVTYSFLNAVPANETGDPAYQGFTPFDANQRAATMLALNLYADVANITFVHGADGADSTAKITYANSSTMPNFIHAWTAYESGSEHAHGEDSIDAAEIWIYSQNITSVYQNGSFDFQVLLHETGHALGLSHPGDYNNNGQPITYEHDAEYSHDSQQYTVMSYFAAAKTGASYQGQYASTLLLHDVAAIQALYGANMTTRAGDTVYGFHSTADRDAYDFTLTPKPVIAIWDGGGNDTVDLSGYSTSSHLDLREGAFSDVGGLTGNLAVCFGAVIENAIGGAGDDRIIGNDTGNTLRTGGGDDFASGGGGNDRLLGGDGDDVLAGGAKKDAVAGGDGNDALAGDGGADVLNGGEGHDAFAYSAASDSAGRAFDKVVDFNAAKDDFDLWFALDGLDAGVSVNRARDIKGALDADHLGIHHAALATVSSGGVYLVVDANGVAGYQAGEDLLISLIAPAHLNHLAPGNFI